VTRGTPLLALSLVLLSACEGERVAEPPPAEPPVVAGVSVEAIRLEPVLATVDAVGTVRSKTQTSITSKVQGYVREVRARQGDRVEKGAVLVTVDPHEFSVGAERAQAAVSEAEMLRDELRQTLAEAEANLRTTEADYRHADATAARYGELYARELISAQEYEGVEARRQSLAAAVEQARARIRAVQARERQVRFRITQAMAEWETARIALGDARIVAPATAVVVDRRVEPGTLAVPGQTLLVLEDPRVYRLEAEVPESEMGRIRLGERVPVILDSLRRTLDGRVAEIVPAADPLSRTVTVKLDLPAGPDLRSGLFGRARFPAGRRRALLVPTTALVERGQLASVYVVDARDVARLRLVTIGARHPDRVEILSGLSAGERVVVHGAARVRDGARVETQR